MAEGDEILNLHRARLAAADRALQQSNATLAGSQRAIADARRLISKRPKNTPAPTEPETREALVVHMRDGLARCRRLRETQKSYKAALARCLIRLKMQHGSLPYESPATYTKQPGTNGKCAVCGATVKRSMLGMTVSVSGPDRAIELHAECFMLWDEAKRDKLTESE